MKTIKGNQTGRGGARKGAGRKPGAVTQKTREIANQAAASGLTPLEYMLGVMRDPLVVPARRDDMAKAASPYMHAKLASVEHSGPNGGPIDHRVTAVEWHIVKPPAA